jgi:hypothetical protein
MLHHRQESANSAIQQTHEALIGTVIRQIVNANVEYYKQMEASWEMCAAEVPR